MTGLVEFLRARYTEAREAEERKVSLPGNLPFQWTAVYEKDDAHVLLGGFHRVGMDEFFEQYGESAADPDVLADLDAKLGILDWYEVASSSSELHSDAWQIMRQVLHLLAVPFTAHPDYREGWKP